MIKRIDHIALAVPDLAAAKKFFIEGLGGSQVWSAPAPGQGFHWTTIDLGSSCLIELINPEGEEGFVQRFLQKRGPGAHHVTIQVDDIQEVHRTLEKRGIKSFGLAEPYPGWKELYIHPRDAFGILIQFAEFDPTSWIEPGLAPRAYRDQLMDRMARDILQLGDPRLRRVAEAVEDMSAVRPEIDRLRSVLKSFRALYGFGRAIAAPQLGINLRLILADLGEGPRALINPEITAKSDETFTLWDDCLSFPGLLVRVRRHARISISWVDESGGQNQSNDLDRATSELLQHEMDHLDGVLAIDHALDGDAIVTRAAFEANPKHFRSQLS